MIQESFMNPIFEQNLKENLMKISHECSLVMRVTVAHQYFSHQFVMTELLTNTKKHTIGLTRGPELEWNMPLGY